MRAATCSAEAPGGINYTETPEAISYLEMLATGPMGNCLPGRGYGVKETVTSFTRIGPIINRQARGRAAMI